MASVGGGTEKRAGGRFRNAVEVAVLHGRLLQVFLEELAPGPTPRVNHVPSDALLRSEAAAQEVRFRRTQSTRRTGNSAPPA